MAKPKLTQTYVNDSATSSPINTGSTQPRSLSDLRSWLHGYRIKTEGDAQRTRASIIIGLIDSVINGADLGHRAPAMDRAARELAELDPSLSWLPGWKPRVAVPLTKGEG
jgi:hypothetical protein